MAFLDTFREHDRRLFVDAADEIALTRGQYLLRRGEPGGDVYILQQGTLDVVDSRQTPEIIFATIHEGAMVGELAFVDDSPRSADVRAASDATVLRWAREDLRDLLGRNPELATTFYATVSRNAAARIRELTEGAASGAFLRGAVPYGTEELAAWSTRIATSVKEAFPAIDGDLRRDAKDPDVVARAGTVLDHLEREVDALFLSIRDPLGGAFAAAEIMRELNPYLTRSALAEQAIHRLSGAIGTGQLLSQVLRDTAAGEGPLGEVIDRWLLDRPSFAALRAMNDAFAGVLKETLPADRARRILFLGSGSAGSALRLIGAVAPPATTFTIVDVHREALAAAVVEGRTASETLTLAVVQESIVALALGRGKQTVPDEQDAVVLPFVLESMPERIALALLTFARARLAPNGVVVLGTLGPSGDRSLVDRLLGWPTIRRTRPALVSLLGAAGLAIRTAPTMPVPAELLVAGPVAPPGPAD